jgi:putative membrane protein
MKKTLFAALIAAAAGLYACNEAGEGSNNTPAADSLAEQKAETDNTRVQPDTNTTAAALSVNEQDFVTEAASGGMLEVELGNLAQQNAANPRVKEFGAMMVRDHSKANDELKQLAANKRFNVPASLKEKHQHHKDELSKKTGKDFDKAYMKMMVDDHQEDIDKFEKASKNSTDNDLKNFAAKTLPVLHTHLDSAKAINKGLK